MPRRGGKSTVESRERERARKERYRARKRVAARVLGVNYREVPLKTAADYPKEYMEIAMAAAAGEAINPILVPNRSAARSVQSGFAKFKFVLRRDIVTAPLFEAANNLVITAKPFDDGSDRWIVEFTPRFYALQAAALKGEKVVLEDPDGLPHFDKPDPEAAKRFMETQPKHELTNHGQARMPPASSVPRSERSEKVHGHDSPTAAERDASEEFFAKWAGKQPEPEEPCQHEWDQYDVCLHCRKPKEGA